MGVSTHTCQITTLPLITLKLNKAGSLTHGGTHTVQISKPQKLFTSQKKHLGYSVALYLPNDQTTLY